MTSNFGSAWTLDVVVAVRRSRMRPLLGLGPLRLATRAACLMSAAAPRPIVTQDRARGGMITIAPGEGVEHTATFIGPIHGLGDTNMGWAQQAAMIHESLPHIKFVLPNAPSVPVTLNGGMVMPSWYDITQLDDRAGQPCDGIEDSKAVITGLIEEEVAAGVPLSRIVVGGFSQGGAMAIYAGLQYDGTLAGLCVMSGYLPKEDGFAVTSAAKATPVAHFHGTDDPVVKIEWARKTVDIVKARGVATYEMNEYYPLGHGASMELFTDVIKWLERVLPADAKKDEL